MYTIFTKYTNWPLVTFNDLWWCLPEFFTIWDEIWYIGKFYMYKFNQMHKLTFGDLWWPLVVFTLLFDQLRWNLLCTYILCIQFFLNTPIDLWWPLMTFGDVFLIFYNLGWYLVYIYTFYVYKFKQMHKFTFVDLWLFSPYYLFNWDKIWYISRFYVYKFNQMHKLTFGDLWWPLVVFTLFFDQMR